MMYNTEIGDCFHSSTAYNFLGIPADDDVLLKHCYKSQRRAHCCICGAGIEKESCVLINCQKKGCLVTPVIFKENKLLLNMRCYIEMGDRFYAYMAYSFLGIPVDDDLLLKYLWWFAHYRSQRRAYC